MSCWSGTRRAQQRAPAPYIYTCIYIYASPCPVPFLIPFVTLAQRDPERPPARCWAPSLSAAAPYGSGSGSVPETLTDKGWRVGGIKSIHQSLTFIWPRTCSLLFCYNVPLFGLLTYYLSFLLLLLFFFLHFNSCLFSYFSWLFLTLDSDFFFKFSSKRIPLPALWALTYPKVGDPSFTHLPDRYCTPFPIFLQVSVLAKPPQGCGWA